MERKIKIKKKRRTNKTKIEKDFVKKIYVLITIIALIFAYTLIVSRSMNIIGKAVIIGEEKTSEESSIIAIPTIYKKSPFDWVLPNTIPEADEITDTISIFASPGEYEPASFVVYPDQDMKQVTAHATDLIMGANIIPKENINIKIVKVWLQAGLDRRMEEPILVPELLLYNDNDILTGGIDPDWNFIQGIDQNALFFKNTTIRYNSTKNGNKTINANIGTIDFWFKTEWLGNNNKKRVFFRLDDKNSGYLSIELLNNNRIYANYMKNSNLRCYISTSGADPMQWHRVTITWNVNEQRLNLYFDGNSYGLKCTTNGAITEIQPDNYVYLSPTFDLYSAMDSFRIYNYEASQNEIQNGFKNSMIIFNESFDSESSIKNNTGFAYRFEYIPPLISTSLETDITAQTSKQFWINVKVPEDAKPGIYKSNVTLSSSNSNDKIITLEVNVLPIILKEPSKKYIIFYQHKPKTNLLSEEEILDLNLDDIHSHGFEGTTLNVLSDENYFRNYLYNVLERGMDGPFIFDSNNYQNTISILQEYNLPKYHYGIDEPNSLNKAIPSNSLRHQIRESYNIHQAGGLVVTSILYQNSKALDDPTSYAYDQIDPASNDALTFKQEGIVYESLDIANYHATELNMDNLKQDKPLWDYIQRLRNGSEEKNKSRIEVYYWQIWVEKPKLNRLQSGYFLWTSKLDGIMPWSYQANTDIKIHGDPFDDFDGIHNQKLRDTKTTYPSQQGPIPTTKWEALREGYDDVRYLTTLYELLDELNKTKPGLASSIDNEIKNELTKYNNPQDYNTIPADDYQNTRWLIVQKIMLAQNTYPITNVTECGDEICESDESCQNCPTDCGTCNGGGGGGSSGSRNNYCGDGICNSNEDCSKCARDCGDCIIKKCIEDWECSKWTVCSEEGLQTRNCIDIKNCNTIIGKPETTRYCTPITAICNDGIKNQNEEMIDCGGICEPCAKSDKSKVNLYLIAAFILLGGIIFAIVIVFKRHHKPTYKNKI